MASSPSKSAGCSLEGASFSNPDASKARSCRRGKLAASRTRMATKHSNGGDNTGGSGKGAQRLARMLRNRESAALSRKRRNDRVEKLEIQVENLEEENRQLRDLTEKLENGFEDCCGFQPLPPATATHFFRRNVGHSSCVGRSMDSATAPYTAAASFNVISQPAVFA